MNDDLQKRIDAAVEAALNGDGDMTLEEAQEFEEYILEYQRNTPEEQQTVEDFEEYMDSFWRNR